MLLERFHAILILEPLSRAHNRSFIYHCSREHTILNFHARSLPILFIWPNDVSGAISCNSETAIYFACALALVNLPLLAEDTFLNFCARSLPILFIWPIDATGAISHNSETSTFLMRALALINLSLLPGVVLLEFPCTMDSNNIYLA